MFDSYRPHLLQQLEAIRAAGTYKRERVIVTPQGTTIRVADGQSALYLCANNYLGLTQHPAVAKAASRPTCRRSPNSPVSVPATSDCTLLRVRSCLLRPTSGMLCQFPN